MSGQLVVRSIRPRNVTWPVWLTLVLALAAAILRITAPSPSITGTLIAAAPFLFAAAVFFVRPLDRRFVYGAAAIALAQAIVLAGSALPGAWISQLPVLLEARSFVGLFDGFILLGGLILVGLALGAVRSAVGWLIVALGAAGAAIGLWSVLTSQIGDPLLLAVSLASVAISPLVWSFLFAAALDARRPLFAVGSGILCAAIIAVNYFLLLLPPFGSETDFGLIQTAYGAAIAAGWLALAVAPLFGEVPGELSGESAPATRPD